MKSRTANPATLAPSRPRPRLGWVRLLSLIALGLSAFLLWGSVRGEQLPGCGLESDCGTVLHSRWAKFFGIPVSLPALLLYASVLFSTGVLHRAMAPSSQRRIWAFLVAVAAALIGAATWFIALQLLVIQAICPFCMTAHVCGMLTGALLLYQAPRMRSPRTAQGRRSAAPVPAAFALAPGTLIRLAAAGLGAVAILGVGQVIYQPKTFDIQPVAAGAPRPADLSSSNTVRTVSGAAPAPPTNMAASAAASKPSGPTTNAAAQPDSKVPRTITLHGGAFTLNLNEVPLIGSPDAPFIIVSLFDYSCQHCRLLHPLLMQAVRDWSNQLAVVSLPVPLATNCNRLIKRPIPDHINACAYAYAGLTLWRANPEKLLGFDDWVFIPPRPAAPAVVEAEARRLAGETAFATASHDPWIKQQLDLAIRIFETNYLRYHRSSLPQLMIGTNIVTGIFRSTNDLYRILSAQLPLRVPDPARAQIKR